MATLLKSDGTRETIAEPLTLESMQRLVGGYIEFVTLSGSPGRREILIVNEEGLLKDLPRNPAATQLYRNTRVAIGSGDIVGDVIHCFVTNEGAEHEAYE